MFSLILPVHAVEVSNV